MLQADTENFRLLGSADVFYCCGGFHRFPTLRDYIDLCDEKNLNVLRERIQYDSMAYIGICAGAMLASDALFGLVPTVEIVYDANSAPEDTSYRTNLKTSSGKTVLQMTSGCGFSIDIWHKRPTMLHSFPVVKNKAKWYAYADMNTSLLQEAGKHLECVLVAYLGYSNETWFFSIRGEVLFSDGRYYLMA